jgi:hypothetical protein
MLASITPLGERGRRSKWGITCCGYILGSLLGGASVGTLAGLVGWLAVDGVPARVRVAVLAAALAIGLVSELAPGGVPGPRRQVDKRWLDRYRGWVYGLGYGAQLGAGITTVVVSSAAYAVPLAAFLSARPAIGGAIGAIAGALRGATVLATARVGTPERLVAFHGRMRTTERPVRAAALLAQLSLAGLAMLAVAG